MTIGTAPLTPEATWREINALVAFLRGHGVEQVAITYGWGCQADGIVQPVTCPLDELVSRLQQNIAQGIYHLGEDNLYIEVDTPRLTITLCHDADIHCDADDALEALVRDEWMRRGHHVWPTVRS